MSEVRSRPREADLHVHTDVSDGTMSPQEVVAHARRVGLAAIAIADHDAVNAIDSALECAEGTGLEIVPAVELTSEVDGREMHLLGFHIQWWDLTFRQRLVEFQKVRLQRAKRMVERLADLGLPVPLEEVMALSLGSSVGRLHVAQALAQRGLVGSIEEAFRRYIGDGLPAYVPKARLTPQEAIDMVLAAGGIPVLAHPRLLGRDELIPQFVEMGLRGIEAYHNTDQVNWDARRYETLAEEYGLVLTGGSDCHGMAKGRIMMGEVRVPYRLVEELNKEHLRMEQERHRRT